MKTRHLVMSIEGLEKKLNSLTLGKRNKYCFECFGMNYLNVNNALKKYKDIGYKFIPGSGCENIKNDGSCGC